LRRPLVVLLRQLVVELPLAVLSFSPQPNSPMTA
jgi:hypothetical protein